MLTPDKNLSKQQKKRYIDSLSSKVLLGVGELENEWMMMMRTCLGYINFQQLVSLPTQQALCCHVVVKAWSKTLTF